MSINEEKKTNTYLGPTLHGTEPDSGARPNHLGLGIAFGVSIGTALGVALNNLALGIGFGIALGTVLGLAIPSKSRK